ncbi:2275_t:CDS:2 [Ambispora gerdemannii]|uniref:2275_t:CDS:1 n=1 Tax=Ambispora gerdemannii TaxID=144530 RepID=A0A9N9DEN9_9GLOM|nr:2275_t:CDS:2 [Ambispora gerdemannii]
MSSLLDLKELREVFYAVKDPGPYSSDGNVIKSVDEWINSQGTTRKKVFQLLIEEADESIYACMLGLFYHHGIGVRADHSMAFNSYRFAAESSNDAFAQNQLGYCYRDGLGTIGSSEKAFEWFKKSAERGHICGMRTLADHYYNGWGYEQNFRRAFFWYSKAYSNGNSRAIQGLFNCHEKGYGTQRDMHKALYWAKKDQLIHWSFLPKLFKRRHY